MRTVTGFGHVPRYAGLSGALALLLVTACATHRTAERAPAARSDSVHVGYGTVEADRLVGSVATVKGEGESAPRFRTFIEMLSRVPGVRVIELPNGGMSVRVRAGATSFHGDDEPLFVVDGMAMSAEATITGMNPNNVASITVLRDANETAIYGSRGANGVILIKTKMGGE
ncbi:MAG: TonB-dependent receptor plug domain-containing protein [Gemmatimonadetes bacterium]|nr:TonB-dependent receptor plug domain-containing protein [Gemmatimonadota bacterium]